MKRIKQTLTAVLMTILAVQLCACGSTAGGGTASDSTSGNDGNGVESVSRSDIAENGISVDFEIIGASSGCAINVSPDTAPFMAASFYAYDENYNLIENETLDIKVSLYKFENQSDYKTALENYYKNEYYGDGEKEDPSEDLNLSHVSDLNVKAEMNSSSDDEDYYYGYYYGYYYFDFPEALDEGWYAASFTVNVKGSDFTVYKLIQSTSLSLNSFIASGEYIAWLHDETTGEAIKDAEISFSGRHKASGKTDKDGLLTAEIEENDSDLYYSIITAEYDGRVFCDGLEVNTDSYYRQFKNRYYSYLISDRNIYMPDDEIRFFGMVRNKSLTDTEKPESLTVVLTDYGEDIAQAEVSLNDNGTFEGSISFEDIQSGYYSLSLRSDENEVYELSGIQITEYVKPVYTGSATSEKIAYMIEKEDEKQADIDIELTYYDGTAANGFELGRYYNTVDASDDITLTVDAEGCAEDTFDLSKITSDSWYPLHETIVYSGSDAEDENVYLTGDFYVLPYDVMIEGENDAENETFTFNTYKITTDNLKTDDDIWNYDLLKGGAYDTDVTAKLYKTWWEKVKMGEEYDKIYKETYPVYDYVQHTDLVDTYEAETKDGMGSIKYEFEDDDEELHASYYLEFSYDDSFGNEVTCKFYICNRTFYYNEQDVYMMMPENTVSDDEESSYYGTYYFSDGENSEFNLTYNYEEYEMGENESLLTLTVLSDGTVTPYLCSDGEMDIAFDESLCPNYTIYGMLFDGKYTRELTSTAMTFDCDDRNLEVSVSASQQEYTPGEEAEVTVNVTDAATGKTVPEGTTVLLSVVDEAVFDLSEQDVAVLEGIYARRSLPYVTAYISMNSKMPDENIFYEYATEDARSASSDSANGGTSGDNIRSEFKDTAYFVSGLTDENGNVTFEFTLPDNTTTWRTTALAITSDNFAGDAKSSLTVSLPYFVDPIINDTVLEGESTVFGIRSAGRGVSLDDACSYTVTVEGDGVSESVEVSAGGIRELAFARFDSLEKGDYTVTINGECSGYSDAVQYTFEVVSSGLEIYTGVTSKVSDGIDISPVRYPVDIWIYNKDAKTYNVLVGDLLCSRDIRADERIGYYIAAKLLSEDDPDGYFAEKIKDIDLSDLEINNGYLSLFKGEDGSRELTALAYIAASDVIDPYYTLSVYPEYIEECYGTAGDTSYESDPYYILLKAAAMHEADENTIEGLLDESKSFKESAYLTAALYLAGYRERAEEEYATLVSDAYETSKTVSGETGYYIEGDSEGTRMDNTAAALVLASIINAEEADSFAVYMSLNDSDDDIYPLQEAVYILNAKDRISSQDKVSYTLDGERHTDDINNISGVYLRLTKDELSNLALETVEGEPYMTVFYNGSVEETGDEENNLIGVQTSFDKKSYNVGDTGTYTVNIDLSEFDTETGDNTMIVDIYIPSGMRFNKYTPSDNKYCSWYLGEREGQRLRFVVLPTDDLKKDKNVSIDITFTCVTPGDYISEKAYVSSGSSAIYGLSDRGTVSIAG